MDGALVGVGWLTVAKKTKKKEITLQLDKLHEPKEIEKGFRARHECKKTEKGYNCGETDAATRYRWIQVGQVEVD